MAEKVAKVAKAQDAKLQKAIAESAIDEAKHVISLVEQQNRILEKAFSLVEKAESVAETSRDYQAAATCLSQAIAIIGQMKGGEPGQLQQTINIDFSRFTDEELKTYAALSRKLEEGGAGSGKAAPT